jgi:hypothetical protein
VGLVQRRDGLQWAGGLVAGAGGGIDVSEQRAANTVESCVTLVSQDFSKIYDSYLFCHRERAEAAKMFVAIASAPFVLYSVFGIFTRPPVKIIVDATGKETATPAQINLHFLWNHTPDFVLIFFVICGIFGFVAYQRFLDAHATAYKYTRYLNSFRLLYSRLGQNELFSRTGWSPPAEVDPEFPTPRKLFHWATLFSLFMAIIDSFYVWFRFAKLDDSSYYLFASVAAVEFIAAHLATYLSETRGNFKEQPETYKRLVEDYVARPD